MNIIENNHLFNHNLCSQAYATRDDLGRQRTMLRGVNSRMGGVLGIYVAHFCLNICIYAVF